MKKTIVVCSAIIAIGIVLGMSIVPRFAPFAGSSGVYLDYANEEDLVRNSERIVLGKYIGENVHNVDMKNASDDAVLGKITLTVQQFQNIESLKGSASSGEMTYVAIKSADSYNLPGGGKETFDRETVSLTKGEEYVVFLREIQPRPEYGGQYGDVIWTYVGEPGIAKVQDTGNLQFKATDRYKKEWDVLSNSDAPFELSKQEIASIVSSGR